MAAAMTDANSIPVRFITHRCILPAPVDILAPLAATWRHVLATRLNLEITPQQQVRVSLSEDAINWWLVEPNEPVSEFVDLFALLSERLTVRLLDPQAKAKGSFMNNRPQPKEPLSSVPGTSGIEKKTGSQPLNGAGKRTSDQNEGMLPSPPPKQKRTVGHGKARQSKTKGVTMTTKPNDNGNELEEDEISIDNMFDVDNGSGMKDPLADDDEEENDEEDDDEDTDSLVTTVSQQIEELKREGITPEDVITPAIAAVRRLSNLDFGRAKKEVKRLAGTVSWDSMVKDAPRAFYFLQELLKD